MRCPYPLKPTFAWMRAIDFRDSGFSFSVTNPRAFLGLKHFPIYPSDSSFSSLIRPVPFSIPFPPKISDDGATLLETSCPRLTRRYSRQLSAMARWLDLCQRHLTCEDKTVGK
jgi:hypothetical protein